jgi:hypothetical protein
MATSCGWALVEKPSLGPAKLDAFGVYNLSDKAHVYIDAIAEMAYTGRFSYTVTAVGLEEPYLDVGEKRNPLSFKTLCRLVGRFEQAFDRFGIPTVLVPAQTWQTAVLGRFGGKKREDRKKAARIWAKAMFGQHLNQDAADAAGLAYYLATKERP